MVYLLEKELALDSSVFCNFSKVFGLGRTRIEFLCKQLGVKRNCPVKHLTEKHLVLIVKACESYELGTPLKKIKLFQGETLVSIKSYRGLRKKRGLPVRGQSTHTNARTAKKIRY